jgi:Fur family ferric uptake transcriptional regulator
MGTQIASPQPIAARASTIMQRLAEHGYRLTSTRGAIAEAIAARPAQFTARELVEELEPRGIGRATVFRALDLLVQVGLLERLHGDLSCHSYTYCAPEHHHHLVCTGCGQVTSIVAGTVEREIRNLARQANFRPQTHHVEIYGQCQACLGAG